MRLPDNIVRAINSKIEATQKAQQRENELQTAAAQAQIAREEARGVADAKVIAAEGEAEANRKVAKSLTPELIEYIMSQKWDGKTPVVTGGTFNTNDVGKYLPKNN